MSEEKLKLLILWVLYLTYMVLGALIFKKLEYDNEQTQVKHFKDLFEDIYSKSNVSKTEIKEILRTSRESYSLGIDPSVKYQSKWDMAGSFYFVGTVITTIGFGYTAPVTRLGQICFIPYALIGIPLNILLFNTLLDLTVHFFTFFLHHCHRCWRRIKRKIAKQNTGASAWEPTAVSIAFVCVMCVTITTLITAPLFLFLEEWTFFESVYFAVVASTTVGFGDFVPSGAHSGSGQNLTPHYKIGNWIVIIIGMVFMYPAMAIMASIYKQFLNFVVDKCRKLLAKKPNRVLDTQATSSPERSAKPRNRGGLSAEERENITARLVLKTWKQLKKANSIGPLNTVEASILRSRSTPNSRVDQENFSPVFQMDTTPRASIAEGLTTVEELDLIEARVTREYRQILNDIKQQRESIENTSPTNDLNVTGGSIGITNEGIGIAIRISTPIGETNEVYPSQSEVMKISNEDI